MSFYAVIARRSRSTITQELHWTSQAPKGRVPGWHESSLAFVFKVLKNRLSCVIVLLILFSGVAYATIYQTTQNNVTHYSDVATQNANVLKLEPLSTISSSTTLLNSNSKAISQQDHKAIAPMLISIQGLKDQESYLRDINLPVVIEWHGAIPANSQLIWTDNQKQSNISMQSPRFVLQNLDPGEHRLQALALDASGKTILQSVPITIYIKQPHSS